ncbi:MAG: aminotransferase class I/II-fold pyridoxal phosphate-dependent enzyme, partial [Deltaproteobacteria bacterium]|nr:aminotransferase class I/II-fold pyridoxal phosphate-dependent enzyme [Deltaproteobacteria bacterium]
LSGPEEDFLAHLKKAVESSWPRPKLLVLSFPTNPTGQVVSLEFFEEVIAFAKAHHLGVIHDFAYADLYFEGEAPPSILQVKGAKEVAVELYSLSKSYNMPGWRVAFCCGNAQMVSALKKIKSYLDYGMFQPIQIAGTVALNGPQKVVREIASVYQARRDALCEGLNKVGWEIEKPRATMFVWAKIPEKYQALGSIEFSKLLLKEAKVAVSPGVGFGEGGEGWVRFALVENEKRIKQAVRGIKHALFSEDA